MVQAAKLFGDIFNWGLVGRDELSDPKCPFPGLRAQKSLSENLKKGTLHPKACLAFPNSAVKDTIRKNPPTCFQG